MRARALGVVFVLLLAACEQPSEGEPTAGPTGAGEGTPAATKIGLLYTVSDIGGEFAQAALGASVLATEDARGRGLNVEILSRDYAGNASKAGDIARQLADDGAVGIVVASDDPALVPALSDFDEVPVIQALLSDEDVVESGASSFRVAPSNRLQAQKLAEYLVGDRGLDRIAILHDDSPFGVEGADSMEEALDDEGGSVVLRQSFKVGGDIHTPVTHAGQLDADALVLWTRDSAEAGRVTIEMQKANQGYQLVLSGNLATFDYGKNAASQVTPVAFRDGILSVGTWAGPWFDLDRMLGFYERFQEANNALAPFQAVQVYDAILLLAQATRDAGASDPSGVADALTNIRDFEGAGVPISFSPQDHEGIGMEDMAILAFTKNQDSAGGEFAPDISTGGGFFTIDAQTVTLPSELSYLLEGLPE